jgi:Ca2+-binding RTX toxin-like protein
MVEALEQRVCMSAAVGVHNHTLSIVGSELADQVKIGAGRLSYVIDLDGEVTSVPRLGVKRVSVALLGGDDLLLASTKIAPLTVLAGEGNDAITVRGPHSRVFGEGGNDSIAATGGGDFVDAGDGDDVVLALGTGTVLGGNGDDSLQIPGIGDIQFTGGAGHDSFRSQTRGTFVDFDPALDVRHYNR